MNKNTQKDVKPVKKSSNNKATKKNVNKNRNTKVTSENTNPNQLKNTNNSKNKVVDKKVAVVVEKPLKKTKSKETMVKTNKVPVLTNVPPTQKSTFTSFVNQSEDVTDDVPPKFERSNSFSLSRGLSKVKHFFSSSKENLNKDPETELPYKFTRSRSLILMRRSNRRSVIEPQLEQLNEESEKPGEKSPPVAKQEFQYKKTSVGSFAVPATPQENFQRRRSSTFISSLKRTFTSSSDKKEKLNPKWSASLQSLQAIDNMVKYDNMKFINYDQFNEYEKQLEMRLSQRNLETIPPADPAEQYPKGLGHTVAELEIDAATPVFDKSKFSMCVPPVEPLLTDVKSVILVGIEAHVCVLQTTYDLLEKGLDVHVVVDAVSSRSLTDRKFAFKQMERAGAVLTTSECAILGLLGGSDHPKFREVQKLIMTSAPDVGLVAKI